MNSWTPHAVSKEAISPIKEYCKDRHYNENRNKRYGCKGCLFSIKRWVEDPGYTDCVFANCPMSWQEGERS